MHIKHEDVDDVEEDRITIQGVYLGDFNQDSLRLVPVDELTELDAAELVDENDYLSEPEGVPVSCEYEAPPTNPRFSISAVSGIVSISSSNRVERPSVPANELFRRVWCCAEEE